MRSVLCGAMVVVMAMIVGCGDDGPKLYKVTGTVTLDGAPAPEHTTVKFIPVDIKSGLQPASGQTDASGKFEMDCPANPKQKGVLPGDYMVAIDNRVPNDNLTEEEREEKRQRELANGGMVSGGKLKNLIPDKYGNAGSSGLKATVAPNNDNVCDFDLK